MDTQQDLFGNEGNKTYNESSNQSFCRPVRTGPSPPFRTLTGSEGWIHPLSEVVWYSDLEYTDSVYQQEFYWSLV